MSAPGPRSRDAVVVVPGIMGSELVDATTGRALWGLADPRWYLSAWTSGSSLRALALSDEERDGRYGRVRPSRLLRFPAFAPVLAGFAPYTSLSKTARATVSHPDAVLEFPYDWRLPVAHNARLLAERAIRHLADWRAHPEQYGDQPPRLVLIAHSMGGLLARHACQDPAFADEVRAVLTLGTPFYGAPKAVLLLASGRDGPLRMPRARVRELASGLPGVHDLLPSYRCVVDGAGARRLTSADIAALGGSAELTTASFAGQKRVFDVVLPGHVQVVGAHQPTVQALTIDAGTASGHHYTLRPTPSAERRAGAPEAQRVDVGGDGTVPSESARLPWYAAIPLAQSHGAVASAADALLVVEDVLTDRRTGPWQGAGELGIDLPDLAAAGQPFQAVVTGAERPTDVACSVFDVSTRLRVDTPRVQARQGALVAVVSALPPGLYTVQVQGGGAAPLRQMVMVVDETAPEIRELHP
ncbi:hypothetical protein ACFVW1_21630 [Streptomyces olivochromogenes]|uniref:lipase/acyltransferase domain-containing protein n=1 Tax=Streptomyces olivochromogenes TaxID=1963 RepID=UPI0036DCF43F